MTLLTNESLVDLQTRHDAPCLSLYQTTHRHHPENQQDTIRFGNLLRDLGATLLETYAPSDVKLALAPLEALVGDRDFWNHTLDGLAVFSARGLFRVLLLQRPVDDLVVVADSFHLKPLRRLLQSADRYQVLGLSQHRAQLFEGNRYALDEVELGPGVPRTLVDALGAELTEPYQAVGSYGGGGGEGAPMYHGHGGKADEVDNDAVRFFRAVDRGVLEQHSNSTGLPLLLAALPEHHSIFHKVSHNPMLLADGIRYNPESVGDDELRTLAWAVMMPRYEARLSSLGEQFEQALSKDLGSDTLGDVAAAAALGRVATLLIEADRQIEGHLDKISGRIQLGNLSHPNVDDLLDDLGELVVKKGGQVLVVPPASMPAKSGVAAIYRY